MISHQAAHGCVWKGDCEHTPVLQPDTPGTLGPTQTGYCPQEGVGMM